MRNLDLRTILLFLPGIIVGFTIHEFAHAYAAYRLGDRTAKDSGRLTLNPIKHIDPIGFLLIVFAGFGWAKPVQFDPDQLKSKHRDEIIISLAGPLANLLLGVLLFGIAKIFYGMEQFNTTSSGIEFVNFWIYSGTLNFGLFVFNMIPIPPLDGSHLYMTFIQQKNPKLMYYLYRYGTFVLIGIILLENNTGLDILPIGKVIDMLSEWSFKLYNFF